MLDLRFMDKLFASNIIKTTVKEMLEEEIQKIAPAENNSPSRQEVRPRSPSPPEQKRVRKDTLLTMYSEIIEDSGFSSSSYFADEFELFLSELLVDYKTGCPFTETGCYIGDF